MDYQKKKLLSQSIGFFQANMTLTSDILRSLKGQDVLTEEEVSTVQVRVKNFKTDKKMNLCYINAISTPADKT